eukprot:CAMPEP_0176097914 /NCGR_PEP_ID=MMETSP0120_2-20121206/49093_1 /TAXON_ID=160619 /ORGANISM="Kryptoperidinium foliaceum, Strain CCMP 1326" /LENGTH=291 /DNA_ID=CAMNT_0017431919 /DNA_START=78 /DNA_END=953 /DNA_ORIENTATION=-
MGCGGSREATPDEKQFICSQMAKEMMLICVHPAVDSAKTMKIAAPPEFDTLKKGAESLRGVTQADGAAETAATSSGGMMGMVQAGLNKVGSIASQGASALLGGVAGTLDTAVSKVELPFTQVAGAVVTEKRDAIADVLCAHMIATKVPDAATMIASGPKSISDHLLTQATPDIAKELLPKVQDSLQSQPGLKAWNSAIETYNSAAEKVQSVQSSGGLPNLGLMKPIKLDIAMYTCEQTIRGIGGLIADQEESIRKNPENQKTRAPEVFAKVFKGEVLTVADYKAVKKAMAK